MASFDYLAPLSENNDLSWYLDPQNIPNQKLPKATIDFLEIGPRAGFMPPLVFLNFLQKQFDYVHAHMDQGPSIVQYFTDLAIDKDLLHMLLAHLLKWYGGYPVNYMLPEQQATMKAIEKFFLSSPGDTPEKEFAKADMDFAHYLQKLGIAFTTSLKHGIDVREILEAIPGDKKKEEPFKNFDALFEAAKLYGAIGPFHGNILKEITTKARITFEFNKWLTEFKGWEYSDEEGYKCLLTKSNLLAFLRYSDEQKQQQRNQFANEADSWSYLKQFPANNPNPASTANENTIGNDQPIADKATSNLYGQVIDDKLSTVKDAFKTNADYTKARAVIVAYFQYKQVPKQVIVVKNKWKKKLAHALGEVHRELKPHTTIDHDYLAFYTKSFSAFEKDVIDETNLFGNKLYKYSISTT